MSKREKGTERKDNQTGEVEIVVETFSVLSQAANELPFQLDTNVTESNDQVRLANRFLDLRRPKMQKILRTRSQLFKMVRDEMTKRDFVEIQTPILTAPTPEGATDYLVPSRLVPSHFYALPQSPQQFKQLLMVGGIDRYFQIAPCFRNEDARADRAVGEFYQLDAEMSFVDQEDVLQTIEPIVQKIFEKFKPDNHMQSYLDPFPRISFAEAMLKYGSDKPDLRIELENKDMTNIFANSGFGIFKNAIAKGSTVISILAPKTTNKSRSFFDSKIELAKSIGGGGLAYIKFEDDGTISSPIAKLLTREELKKIKERSGAANGDSVFFACENKQLAYKIAGEIRLLLGSELNLIQENVFKFCWIVDFPMFETEPSNEDVWFSHNPFSKAKTSVQNLKISSLAPSENITPDMLKEMEGVVCYQYDLVCNGYELGSGGIRNTDPKEMAAAFKICKVNITHFNAMYKAFTSAGAPPHGGIAIGLERVLMLLSQTTNMKDVIPFPLNSNGIDVLMEAPRIVPKKEKLKSFSDEYKKLPSQGQLEYACVENNVDIAKMAIAKDANINNRGMYGKTPLMVAIMCGSYNVIEYFLTDEKVSSQIDLLIEDEFNRQACDYLSIKNQSGLQKKVLELIKSLKN